MMLVALAQAPAAHAQQPDYPVVESGSSVASLNRERLLSESAYGAEILRRLSERQANLLAENEKLLAELEREEKALTETRRTMDAADFAPLAEAFDNKANRIRAAQAQKGIDLAKALEAARFRFFREVEPVIVEVMQELGITILLNEQAVMLSIGGADITQPVLERLDALYAEGKIGTLPE